MRSILGLVSLILLLTPRVGSAAEAWGQQAPLPRSLLSQEDHVGVSAEARAPFAARLTREVLVGTMAGAAGLIGGGVVGVLVADATTCGIDDCMEGVDTVGVGSVTGIALVAPIGVYLAGRTSEGEGMFLPTLAGSLASGGLTALLLSSMNRPVTPVGVLALALSPIVGSIIGYEVSHAFVSHGKRSAVAGGVRLVPTAGVTRAGTGVFGLAGRF